MNIILNSQPVETTDNSSLYNLLEETNFTSKKGIAVAVNNKVISKGDWKNHQLSNNDKVIVISATKGG